MESTIGLYKTELIRKAGPWKNLADVELATASYIDWYNNRRLHTAIGGIPPAEYEAAYYVTLKPSPRQRLDPTTEASTKPGAASQPAGAVWPTLLRRLLVLLIEDVSRHCEVTTDNSRSG